MRPATTTLRGAAVVLAAGAAVWAAGPLHAQQVSPDDAALVLLHSARRAYNEGQFTVAAQRFGEFLKQYASRPEAGSANYGLALALLEADKPDYAAVQKALQAAIGRGDFPDRPFAMQYMGLVQRELGRQQLEQAAGQPPQNVKRMEDEARRRFGESAASFAAAAEGLGALAKAPADPNAPLGEVLERAAQARCDQCEMLLRSGRDQEAAQAVEALGNLEWLPRARCHELACYYRGYVKFQAGGYREAGRILSGLAPFGQPFGPHARYLLARAHHMAGQRPEAVAQYEAVISDYEARRKAAEGALKSPQALSAPEQARLVELVKGPLPDYVVRASFYSAVLTAEMGRHAEAADRLAAFLKGNTGSSLTGEAQLRLGWCQLQLKDYAGAIKTLTPLASDERLSDRALWWMARARLAGADPANAQAHAEALRAAIEQLNAAAERAKALAVKDAAAKVRRADILMDLGDARQLARQFNQACETYRAVIEERGNPDRQEEALQRRVAALHFSERYAESDSLAQDFERRYPRSTLLPAVLFRKAANAQALADAAEKDPKNPDPRRRTQEANRWVEEAIVRYRRVVEEFGEFKYAHAARYGWATLEYRQGRYARAAAALAGMAEPDRTGELAKVSYLQADCLIRTLPAEADDALTAEELVRGATEAAKLLEGFLGSAGKDAEEAPDALLKLGYCQERLAMITSQDEHRKAAWAQARATYERFQQQFARHPELATATYERARCLEMLGDVNNAINELRRFAGDPLRQAPVAPLAMVHLSRLCQSQNRAAEAVNVMAASRAQYETALAGDPARRPWAAMLVYEHALALRAAGKPAEAADMFDALAKQPAATAGDWSASAAWRAAQCRREEMQAKLRAARAVLERPGAPKQELDAAQKAMQEALRAIHSTIDTMEAQADNVARTARGCRTHQRLLYELAWCCRALAEGEKESARQRMQERARERIKARPAKAAPSGAAEQPPGWDLPIVGAEAVPIQPAEAAARRHYRELIAVAQQGDLAARSRLELAEMEAQRRQYDSATRLLTEALEKSPPEDLAARIHLRLAEAALAREDLKAALDHARAAGGAAAGNDATQAAKIGRYLAGETAMQKKDWAEAVKQLLPFRDNAAFQDSPGVSDRAMLRLGQAFAEAAQWEQARRSLEVLRQRFQRSDWVPEATYAIGWAFESEKRWDDAVRYYQEVTRRSVAETAARAQLRIGLCRLAQDKAEEAAAELMAVPATYGYPQWNAAALVEAGKIYETLKRADEAVRAYRRALKAAPDSPAGLEARQKLEGLTRAD